MEKTLRSLTLKKRISAQLDAVYDMVKDENQQHRTELNNELEDIFEFIINTVTGKNYRNLNLGTAQEPGIDLGDTDEKICYQITSEGNATKIHDCLNKFEKHKLYKKYDRLIILFANGYKPNLDKIVFSKDYSFSVTETLTTNNKHAFQADIEKTGLDNLETIHEYLTRQLNDRLNTPETSIPVINEIIDVCQEQIKSDSTKPYIAQGMGIKIKEKITLNFQDDDDADQMTDYMIDALPHSDDISQVINSRPDLDPADLELHIKDMYNTIRHKHDNPMLTMQSLFVSVTPNDKRDDIAYKTWARRFILKYFENCSIFKKTKEEKAVL